MSINSLFQPGQLSARIAIEHEVNQPDGCGGNVNQWQELLSCWASITPVSAQETVTGESLAAEISHEVIIRHDARVTPHMRIRLKSRILDIATLVDPDEAARYMKILAIERT